MCRLNFSLLIRYLNLLILFTLLQTIETASAEKPASPGDCLKCHEGIWQEELAKQFIHPPFLEKKCAGCHEAGNLSNSTNPLTSRSEEEPLTCAAKSLVPATSHWFEFDAGENQATIILEASYGSIIRSYSEIPLPKLNTLRDLADLYGRDPLTISNVSVLEVNKGVFLTATIHWQTDRPTASTLTYGIEELQQTTLVNRRLSTEHLETLSSLKKGQTYQYKIMAEDAVGNRVESDIFKFSTANTFSNSAKKSADESCCLAAPLGLESHFFRQGDRYLVNITSIRPIKIFFALKKNANLKVEDLPSPENPEDQPQLIKHIITNEDEIVAFIVCKSCHRNFISHHPVNVYPKRGMKIPPDYPTMADGRISCISCHAPHASNLKYRMLKDHRQELCLGCHRSFKGKGHKTPQLATKSN